MLPETPLVAPTAEISPRATVGAHTRIWHGAQIREDARIGAECILGKNVYVDMGVQIGNRVKIQNNSSIFHGATIEDGVFIGPHVILTNDKHPRAITPHGMLKTDADWEVGPVRLCYGSSIGAGAIILPGVTVGRFALVGAGAVVTRDVPERAIAVGHPARVRGFACDCARTLGQPVPQGDTIYLSCEHCGRSYAIPRDLFDAVADDGAYDRSGNYCN